MTMEKYEDLQNTFSAVAISRIWHMTVNKGFSTYTEAADKETAQVRSQTVIQSPIMYVCKTLLTLLLLFWHAKENKMEVILQ